MSKKNTAKSVSKSPNKMVKTSKRVTKPIPKKTKNISKTKPVNRKPTAKKKTLRVRYLSIAKKQKKSLARLLSKLSLFKDNLIRIGMVALAIAVILFVSLDSRTNAESTNGVVSVNLFKQSQEAPKAVTTEGPAQSNNQFSTYPTWAQNFADYGSSTPNKRYWNVNVGWPENGNNEAEYYTDSPTNLRVSNGSLIMEATKQPEPGGLQYASSRVDTDGKLSFLYGRMDVTAELPNGVGTWPAIWFLPSNTKYEDLSPASDTTRFLNGGEMDLVEEVGFNPNIVYGVVHTLQTNQNNPNAVGDFNQVTVASNNVQYNTYTLLWTPTSITFEINNTPFFTYTKPASADYTTWPFDQPFYMIMNLALGGEWGGEDTAQFPGNGIDNSILPASMNIKSIYYYSYIGATSTN